MLLLNLVPRQVDIRALVFIMILKLENLHLKQREEDIENIIENKQDVNYEEPDTSVVEICMDSNS
jgi:hypothetical protein